MVKIHKILTGLALWGIISAGAVLCPVWAGAKQKIYKYRFCNEYSGF